MPESVYIKARYTRTIRQTLELGKFFVTLKKLVNEYLIPTKSAGNFHFRVDPTLRAAFDSELEQLIQQNLVLSDSAEQFFEQLKALIDRYGVISIKIQAPSKGANERWVDLTKCTDSSIVTTVISTPFTESKTPETETIPADTKKTLNPLDLANYSQIPYGRPSNISTIVETLKLHIRGGDHNSFAGLLKRLFVYPNVLQSLEVGPVLDTMTTPKMTEQRQNHVESHDVRPVLETLVIDHRNEYLSLLQAADRNPEALKSLRNFSNLDLSNVDFTTMDLKEVNFSGADTTGATFTPQQQEYVNRFWDKSTKATVLGHLDKLQTVGDHYKLSTIPSIYARGVRISATAERLRDDINKPNALLNQDFQTKFFEQLKPIEKENLGIIESVQIIINKIKKACGLLNKRTHCDFFSVKPQAEVEALKSDLPQLPTLASA